jgi:hypothetical protein
MDTRHTFCLFLLSSFCLLAACKSIQDSKPPREIEAVSFLNKGVVIPDALITLVTIDHDSICFISTQSTDTISSWCAFISADDFDQLNAIIHDHNLADASDPVLPPGINPCLGHSGMEIIFTTNTSSETLTISGGLWCAGHRQYWPDGLPTLVDFQENLVVKYQP